MPVTISMHCDETNMIDKLLEIQTTHNFKTPEDLITALKENNPLITHSSKKNKKEIKKDKKNANDKPKVAKPPSGYMLFSNDNRASVTETAKAALKDGEKYKASETLKKLGAMWSALSDEDKKKWNDKSKASA